MPFTPNSYAFILNAVRQNRGTAALLTNRQLETLLTRHPADEILAGTIIGETLLRHWLYCRPSPPDNKIFPQFPEADVYPGFLEVIRQEGNHSHLPMEKLKLYEPKDRKEEAIVQHLLRRINIFLDCDGIIPLATDYSEDAIAVPFKLTCDCDAASITDRTGKPLSQWLNAVKRISSAVQEKLSIELLCETGDLADHLDGQSIGLAVILAYLRKQAFLPDHSPLELIGTGIFENGRLQATGGIEGKLKLAERMCSRLVYPGAQGEPLGQPAVNDNIKVITSKLNRLITDGEIAIELTPHGALKRLEELEKQVHRSQVDQETAQRILKQLTPFFDGDSESSYSKEGSVRTTLLQGQMANHAGRPKAAHPYLKEAIRKARALKNPTLYTKTTTNLIVSLVDLGQVDDAEALGQTSLEEIAHNLPGTAEAIEACRMALHGTLGQALRTKALLSRSPLETASAAESLSHLNTALDIATELEDPSEICRDQTELLLWYALLKPKALESVYSDTMKVLHRYASSIHSVSEYFACRARWLAAYRLYLCEGHISADFENRELPDCRDSGLGWLAGTSQKYRGTLLAATGKKDEAREAFYDAVRLLSQPASPLMHFICATAALQGGELLEDESLLKQAQLIFKKEQERFPGDINGAVWLKRCEDLLKGGNPDNNPQLHFQY